MRSVEAMVERVTDRKTAGGGEVDGGPLVFHGGWGWHQLRAASVDEECGQCSQRRGMRISSTTTEEHRPLKDFPPTTCPGVCGEDECSRAIAAGPTLY
jgi:hypothetical protein